MQSAKNLKEYRGEVKEALDNEFLRRAMDNFAKAYPVGRANGFKEIDVDALIDDIAARKDASIARLEELYEEFKAKAEANGIIVHRAATAHEANEMIAQIARDNGCKSVVKSKSMTAEETHLNHHLEADNLEVIETDLGEWIIQMRKEGPTHMVMPAIHLSRDQVAELFSDVTKQKQTNDIQKLVKVARRELRQKYVDADMGVSGGNFAIAETGTIGIVTNEGNARLVTTLPKVHVALMGLDKLTPNLNDALTSLRALPRNATGQQITSYVTWITGPNECQSAEGNKKIMHIVFLDNGRSAMAKDPKFAEVLRCIRCGACANVCPVYRMVGGHQFGHIYIGAIGLILTYFFHGREKAKHLVQNCINCGACKNICAAGIDLPRIIKEIHAIILEEDGHPAESKMLGMMMKNRKMFHGLLRAARFAQAPLKKGRFIRHLPMMFFKEHDFRTLPAVAEVPFRDKWEKVRVQEDNAKFKVALFGGCAQDFLYPEQLEAAVTTIKGRGAQLEFPMDQSCCGLPLQMMGETKALKAVVEQNLAAIDPAEFDYILTLCASCASMLKHSYTKVCADDPNHSIKAKQFAEKVIDYSSFMKDILGVDERAFASSTKKVTYHAPCHLCRGMDVHEAPRSLISTAGMEYVPAAEEEVCCGFGGSYSVKFPELSEQILNTKLNNTEATGAQMLVTDCPGCVMQIRGGFKHRGSGIEVKHIAEALADQMK